MRRWTRMLQRGAAGGRAGEAHVRQLLMGLLALLPLLLLSPMLRLGPATVARAEVSAPPLYTQSVCTPVYAAPDTQSLLLAQLTGGADVTPLGTVSAGGASWQHVTFWSGIEGYIQASALGPDVPRNPEDNPCDYPGVPSADIDTLPAATGPFPLDVRATVSSPATLSSQPSDSALPVAGLALGTPLRVTAWTNGAGGRPWYRVTSAQGTGWVWSALVRLDQPNPATHLVRGKPVWAPVVGKGMQLVNYVTHHSDPATIVQAAKRAGLTHLYAEVAITRFGFYGRNSLDRLLPAAHAAGLPVIAWVYPNLDDVSADVRLTAEVAAYRTPSGDQADGIATDVEEVTDSASVYSYGQLLRAVLGPDLLLVSVVFHPYARTGYPYAATAASWNVLSPMDYWHSHAHRSYSAQDVERFLEVSLTTVRAAMSGGGGAGQIPIEEVGQAYDMFTNNGTGARDAPTAGEINADMQAARALGCVGISWFEWQTATQAEWQAISAFHW